MSVWFRNARDFKKDPNCSKYLRTRMLENGKTTRFLMEYGFPRKGKSALIESRHTVSTREYERLYRAFQGIGFSTCKPQWNSSVKNETIQSSNNNDFISALKESIAGLNRSEISAKYPRKFQDREVEDDNEVEILNKKTIYIELDLCEGFDGLPDNLKDIRLTSAQIKSLKKQDEIAIDSIFSFNLSLDPNNIRKKFRSKYQNVDIISIELVYDGISPTYWGSNPDLPRLRFEQKSGEFIGTPRPIIRINLSEEIDNHEEFARLFANSSLSVLGNENEDYFYENTQYQFRVLDDGQKNEFNQLNFFENSSIQIKDKVLPLKLTTLKVDMYITIPISPILISIEKP